MSFCQPRVVCHSLKRNQMTSKMTKFESLLEAVPDALVGIRGPDIAAVVKLPARG